MSSQRRSKTQNGPHKDEFISTYAIYVFYSYLGSYNASVMAHEYG